MYAQNNPLCIILNALTRALLSLAHPLPSAAGEGLGVLILQVDLPGADLIPLTPFSTVEKGGFEIIAIMLFRNFSASVRLRVSGGDILSITEEVLGFLRWRNSTRRNLCRPVIIAILQ